MCIRDSIYSGCYSHTFPASFVLQSRVNFGITETPVHFVAVEMVAIHGEYNTLHLAGPVSYTHLDVYKRQR